VRANASDRRSAARWDLDRIVAELRASRGRSQQDRRRNGAVIEMPSREALREILDGLFAVLFPTHFGSPDLTDEGIDYFVGHKLDAVLGMLFHQVKRELQFAAPQSDPDLAQPAFESTREFAERQ
jgi:serine O-acetyltransferase